MVRTRLVPALLGVALVLAGSGTGWASPPDGAAGPEAGAGEHGLAAPESGGGESAAATGLSTPPTAARAESLPPRPSAAPVPGARISAVHDRYRDFRFDAVVGEVGVYAIEFETTVWAWTAGCPVTALRVHQDYLYLGCDDGQVQIYDARSYRARKPVLVRRHRYPNAIRAFVLRDGVLLTDAPAIGRDPNVPLAEPPTAPGARLGPSAAFNPDGTRVPTREEQRQQFYTAYSRKQQVRRRRLGRDLMIGGFGGLGLAYGLTLYSGLGFTLGNPLGAAVFVPVVGPFISATQSEVPAFDVTMGMLQVTALSIGIAGAVIVRQERTRVELTASISPRNVGPRLTLRF